MMGLDRSELCSRKYTAESACWADSANRCFWSKLDSAKGICLSADYAEVGRSSQCLLLPLRTDADAGAVSLDCQL